MVDRRVGDRFDHRRCLPIVGLGEHDKMQGAFEWRAMSTKRLYAPPVPAF